MAVPRAARRGLVIAALVAAALALLVAVVLSRVGDGRPRQSKQAARTAAAATSLRVTESAAPGHEAAASSLLPNRGEAVDAAIAYATASQQWLYATDDEITAAIAAIATPTASTRLAAETVAELSEAREQLASASGRVWWWVRPLAWRVDADTGDAATVSVWVVTVLSAAGVAVPQAEWMTVTLDLVWFEGGWRVDSAHDRPGPTPITGPRDQPWDAEPFDKRLAEFTRLGEEPAQ